MTGRRRHLDDLQGEIQELFADLWQVPRYSGVRRGFRPACDFYRTEDPPTLHVVVELPDVDPSTVEVVAAGSALVVAGARQRPPTAGAHYLSLRGDRLRRLRAPHRARLRGRRVARQRVVRARSPARDASTRGPRHTSGPEYQVVVTAEEQQNAQELGDELPATLPVLPLKETVVFRSR